MGLQTPQLWLLVQPATENVYLFATSSPFSGVSWTAEKNRLRKDGMSLSFLLLLFSFLLLLFFSLSLLLVGRDRT